MGSTFVSIGESGFWIGDGLLELWLRLASLHIEDPLQSGGIATKIRDEWLLASRGYVNGCVPIRLGENVATAEGKQLVGDAFRSLQRALGLAGAEISGDAMNLLGIEGRFGGGIETWRLIEVGQAFLDLIDGKVTTTADDKPAMPGSCDRRG